MVLKADAPGERLDLSVQNHLFVGSRAADFVAPWIQILAKLTVKGILGRRL
jgi:hypothetical protein